MGIRPVVPRGEGLRRALRWLGERGRWDLADVDEASRRFDLTPLEEEFLLRHVLHHEGLGTERDA